VILFVYSRLQAFYVNSSLQSYNFFTK
jgi:hypothetical protein